MSAGAQPDARGLRPREVLAAADHRPWPLPPGPWILFQRWHDLLFAHWPLAPERLAPLLPAGLALDTFEGRAWLGVVPFRMSDVRLRGLPRVPGAAAFPELNVRTYVRAEGVGGVWFFSLDASSALAVRGARAWFALPYFRACMRCETDGEAVRYASRRTHRGAAPAALEGTYAPAGRPERAAPGSLAHWLTERYCLFARRGRALVRADIHHPPWPLQPATARLATNTMAEPLGLALAGEPLLHFARRLDVCVWRPRRVRV